ncbi:hypothetical protein GDO81_017278 [Engystomops pustulosus]|uniref:Uncharacterized protein n=1 Tax=Engystomops pustulosus TaxID=76066 RepID=A0AAV7AMG8_ENGPU|nr:hypothetical protein GDO81_017278 [Engystomops pustulosus]
MAGHPARAQTRNRVPTAAPLLQLLQRDTSCRSHCCFLFVGIHIYLLKPTYETPTTMLDNHQSINHVHSQLIQMCRISFILSS